MKYPAKERQRSGFKDRLSTALFRSGAIKHAGKDAVLLALFVATKEDLLHYQRPPQIWRAELMDQLAIGSPKGVIAARKAAIDSGIIHYVEGSRTKPPTYWTLVPDWLAPHMRHVPNRNAKRNASGSTCSELEREAERETERFLTQYPVPSKRRPRFHPPSVEEVRAYCTDRRNNIDAEHFVDHYSANGWVQGKGKPIRDWKAAVRTWERNGLATRRNGSPPPSSPKKAPPLRTWEDIGE